MSPLAVAAAIVGLVALIEALGTFRRAPAARRSYWGRFPRRDLRATRGR